eukprot:TRINITY_DN47479_c0_g1_i1.p1 TRINITY_DN47479_c0_g1~~TRINITY_DN47479_c0_g1_i1.p1  ORF type:complete len:200 (-),score=30.27 TRINITY_DN47479_c0_g1_i1:84-683(-)
MPSLQLLACSTVAAGAVTYLYLTRRGTSKRRVAVASTARQKIEAAQRALGGTAEGFKAPSLVSDQPVGLDETLLGAKNRLAALIGARPDADLAVSIENGIVRISGADGQESWMDLAVVIVRDLRSGAESVATSAGVRFPTKSVDRWADAGRKGTVGDVLAEELGCDKQDPHSSLTNGSFTRTQLLEHAIRVAGATLRSQ